jgi:sulfatase modifying factor 1
MTLHPLAVLLLAAEVTSSAVVAGARPTVGVDLGGGVSLDLVLVRAGTFRQGSPATEAGRGDDETARDVTLSRDFYIGRVPVTRGQFARFVSETGYRTEAEKGASGGHGFDGRGLTQRKEYTWLNPGFAQDDSHPVVIVTYDDALAFTQWLSRKARRDVTLPTEAQWEMACRAGTRSRFYQDASDQEASTIGWFKSNAGNGTRAVGQKKPNGLGLSDMSGNVNEWVHDWYGPYVAGPVRDPEETRSTLSDKPRRGLRGGSWLRDARHARCAARYRNTPGSRNADNGFRVAASVEENAAAAVPSPRPVVGAAEPADDGERPWTWLIGLVIVALFVAPVVLLVWLGRKLLGTMGRGVRTRLGQDGFWIYGLPRTRGQTISYRAIVDGAPRSETIVSPGPEGEFVYTGGKVSRVEILNVAGAAAASGFGERTDDSYWRRSEHQDDQRSRDDSSFTGYPSAY